MPETTTTKVPTMTRQHFAFIASVIASLPVHETSTRVIAFHFANELAGTNVLFNKDRFISACYDS
jgi:hypothetical protein